jgi:hypothetical protein
MISIWYLTCPELEGGTENEDLSFLLKASRVPKSVSAEMTIRSSAAALAMISSSVDACMP